MGLPLAAALALAAQCAPTIAPETLLSVVQVESRFEPLAIGVNGLPRITVAPASVPEAVATAERLIAAGRSVDLGLAQINSRNLPWLGLSVADVFDPCTNFRAAARILQQGYARSDAGRVGEQAALRTALSYYNTGHPLRGVTNGYVSKVSAAAGRIVPALATTFPADLQQTATAPAVPAARAWDVFGEVREVAGFVTTVVIAASGERQ